ncbi:hypothetical protein TNCV_3144851 [Trichonephila clavipes]|nr:hypothetical protein TNCV_3144851 [Trichonephila clavipes]
MEEFLAVGGDNVCTAPIMADKNFLEFVQNSTDIIDVDLDDENEMNNAAPVPTSSETRNIMKKAFIGSPKMVANMVAQLGRLMKREEENLKLLFFPVCNKLEKNRTT